MRAAAMGRGGLTSVVVGQESCPQVHPGTSFGRVMQSFLVN